MNSFSSTNSQSGPLTGLKVLEATHVMAGPTCGLMLADMGADVIKVEKLPEGDDTRRAVPPQIQGESAAFMMMNRNKRGIGLNLKHKSGKKVFKHLATNSDILIENFRKGSMDRLGLGYEQLNAENPGLIYCSLSGFGQTGPYADQGGFDLIAQGMSGLMSITGEGRGRSPVKVGAPMTDITAGILAAMGILAAYIHRQKTGQGQVVDTSLFEAGIIHTYWQSAIYLATGISPTAMGSSHPLMAPYQAFETEDGWINIGAANQNNWERLLNVLNASHLAKDKRFLNNASRMTNLNDLVEILSPYFLTKTTQTWLDQLKQAGIPSGPVLSIASMHADPQVRSRKMVTEVQHSRLGSVKTLGMPVKFSLTPASPARGAPILGEHTLEILKEHGYSQNEIKRLESEGTILIGS